MRLFREPLVHFLIIGAAIFVLSLVTGRGTAGTGAASGGPVDRTVIVTAAEMSLLSNGFVLDNGRAPTDAELQKLVDAYVREEILVREARAQGLDRDDSIVRRRLVQKMEFAVADPAPPPDADLQTFLAGHPEMFRAPDGNIPALADIHAAVLAAWMNDQRKVAVDAMYEKYRAAYQVVVQPAAATQAAGHGGGAGS